MKLKAAALESSVGGLEEGVDLHFPQISEPTNHLRVLSKSGSGCGEGRGADLRFYMSHQTPGVPRLLFCGPHGVVGFPL